MTRYWRTRRQKFSTLDEVWIEPQTSRPSKKKISVAVSILSSIRLAQATSEAAKRGWTVSDMKQDWKVGFRASENRIVRARTFPQRGKSAENVWRPHFLRDRALPHRRHRFAATKICASCFAASLPQDLSAQVMFDLGKIPAARLKPFPWFGISRRPVQHFARRAGSDAAQVPVRTQDFAWLLGSLPAMRLKRFRPHAFSLRPRATQTPTAFALP
jgi:hypothetical protein